MTNDCKCPSTMSCNCKKDRFADGLCEKVKTLEATISQNRQRKSEAERYKMRSENSQINFEPIINDSKNIKKTDHDHIKDNRSANSSLKSEMQNFSLNEPKDSFLLKNLNKRTSRNILIESNEDLRNLKRSLEDNLIRVQQKFQILEKNYENGAKNAKNQSSVALKNFELGNNLWSDFVEKFEQNRKLKILNKDEYRDTLLDQIKQKKLIKEDEKKQHMIDIMDFEKQRSLMIHERQEYMLRNQSKRNEMIKNLDECIKQKQKVIENDKKYCEILDRENQRYNAIMEEKENINIQLQRKKIMNNASRSEHVFTILKNHLEIQKSMQNKLDTDFTNYNKKDELKFSENEKLNKQKKRICAKDLKKQHEYRQALIKREREKSIEEEKELLKIECEKMEVEKEKNNNKKISSRKALKTDLDLQCAQKAENLIKIREEEDEFRNKQIKENQIRQEEAQKQKQMLLDEYNFKLNSMSYC